MKRINRILICFLLTLFVFPMHIHAGNDRHVMDEAGLLSEDESARLNEKAEKLSDQYRFGVYIHTVRNREDASDDIRAFTEKLYSENNYGYGDTSDGVLFLIAISPDGGSYDIYTPGNAGRKMISTDGVNLIADAVSPRLHARDYDKACEAYLDSISSQLSFYEKNGSAETRPDENTEPPGSVRFLLVFVLPSAAALIAVLIMLQRNRTKHHAKSAEQYVSGHGIHMHTVQDIFLYRTETRTPLPRNDSVSDDFSSSSAGSHSGGNF